MAEGADELVHQQRIVIESSRFDIPALVHEECLTGFTAYGATVYPAAIAWGATWDPELVAGWPRRSAATWLPSACTRASPPCSTWCATTGGDGSRRPSARTPTSWRSLGTAYVQGLQSAGVIATLKHFAGYSASRAARNHGPVSMGPVSCATSSCPRSRWPSRSVASAR